MSLPNIDTFEHDISEEIKSKEATIGDIAAASGDVGNIPVRPSSSPILLLALGAFFLLAVVGLSIFLILSYRQGPISNAANNGAVQGNNQSVGPGVRLSAVSSSMDASIGQYVSDVQKSEYGYAIQLTSYSDVFAYMLRNENQYADEIASAVGAPRDTSTSTFPFMFTDVTINNQNMRVGTTGSSTVVYAFVNAKYLLISKTTEGILTLRSAILR